MKTSKEDIFVAFLEILANHFFLEKDFGQQIFIENGLIRKK